MRIKIPSEQNPTSKTLSMHTFVLQDTGHEYMASRVINANMWKESSRSYVYYITFRAEKDYRYFPFGERMPISFEAKVRDKQLDIDVLFCRKLNH